MEGASQLSTQPSPKGATGVFRVATECGYGPTKGSESPFATEGKDGGGLPKAKSQQPTAKSQQPIEEPMLAEAEIERGALPEMEDPFLAIAEQMQDIRMRGEQVRQEVAQLIENKDNLQ